MSRQARIRAYGSALAVAVGGAVAGVLVGGLTGEVIALALGALGLGAVLLLVFYEIGRSEERAIERDEQHRRGAR